MGKPLYRWSDREQYALDASIARAESSTGMRIIPTVADTSSDYLQAEDRAGYLFAFVTLFLVLLCINSPLPAENDIWLAAGIPGAISVLVLVAALLAFVAGSLVVEFFPATGVYLVSRGFQQQQVRDRATQIHRMMKLNSTDNVPVMLVYFSCREGIAVIKADSAVVRATGAEELNRMAREISDLLQRRSVVSAITAGMSGIANSLANAFPLDVYERARRSPSSLQFVHNV